MKLRRAGESDVLDVMQWRNDPATVAMCGSAVPVRKDDHYRWYQRVMADPERFMFIAMEGTRKLGVIRFDKTGDAYTVSINVAPEERGKGYGGQILQAGILRLGDYVGRVPLLAEIRGDNLASIRIFERAGFEVCAHEDGRVHYRRP
jgi:RimJ/RimL family protein N-acetyltransferase